jgi:hypothetical protein
VVVRALAAAAVVATLAACATVPTSGSVHLGRSLLPAAGPDTDVVAVPSGPRVDLGPTGIVTSFLDALIDSNLNYSIARRFLVPGTSWEPAGSTTLYEEDSEVATRKRPSAVEVSLSRVGVVDAHGNYRVSPAPITVRFGVTRDTPGHQWRISRLPPGVLLSTSDARHSLQQLSLYYFNQAETRLVAAPVLEPPDQPGLATTLLRGLLAGPAPALAPAVVSAASGGITLVGNVPVDDGVAEVDLSSGVQQLSAPDQQRLSAQIVWTLRQVPSVQAVRLLVAGSPLTDTGLPAIQSIDAWQQFAPGTESSVAGALVSRHGRTSGFRRSVPSSLSRGGLDAATMSADGTEVAALRTHHGRVSLVAGTAVGGVRRRLTSTSMSPPAFEPDDDVLTVAGSGASAVVEEIPSVGPPQRVSVPAALRAKGITDIAMSRDGTRVAMTVGPAGASEIVMTAASVARGRLTLRRPRLVVPAVRDAEGLAWAGPDELVTTVLDSPGHRAVAESTVDGYRLHLVSTSGLPRQPTQVAAAPGQPVLAVAAGSVWLLADRSWQRIAHGDSASYAG